MFKRILRALGGRASDEPAEIADREQYQGFELQARPIREGGYWRVAGRICRTSDPDGPYHDFIRVDTMASHDEVVQLSLTKARQIVDERGEATVPEEKES